LDNIIRALQYSILVENAHGIELCKGVLSCIRNLQFPQNCEIMEYFLKQINLYLSVAEEKIEIWNSRSPTPQLMDFKVNLNDMQAGQLLQDYENVIVDSSISVSPASQDSEATDPAFLEPLLLNGVEDVELIELERYLLSD